LIFFEKTPVTWFTINGVPYSPDPDFDAPNGDPNKLVFSYGPINVYSSVELRDLRVDRTDGERAYYIGKPDPRDDITFWTTACERIFYYLSKKQHRFYTDGTTELIFFEKTTGVGSRINAEIAALRSELACLAYKPTAFPFTP
jgi:hypothetical protein